MSTPVHGDLKPGKIKTIGVDANTEAINVINRSQVDTIWFTVDGSLPALGGGGTAFPCTDAVQVPTVNLTDIVLVRLVCATAVAYSVWGDAAPMPE
jgi:hypothetical protein